jgi:hypothetical protein
MVETISQLFLDTIKSYPKDDLMLYKKEEKYKDVINALYMEEESINREI